LKAIQEDVQRNENTYHSRDNMKKSYYDTYGRNGLEIGTEGNKAAAALFISFY